MFWKKKTAAKVTGKASDLSAYIDEASTIEGKYTFSGTVMLNGKLTGEVWSNDTLIIGEKGVVHASVRAGIVLVSGEVRGNILGTDRVELRGTARVFGDVEAAVIVVEEGVVFEGHCRMTKGRAEKGSPVAAAAPLPAPDTGPGPAAPQRDLSVVTLKR